jgi:16S rRNA (cytosine967-C5)-methyltransferase
MAHAEQPKLSPARRVATEALARQLRHADDELEPLTPDTKGLDPRDAGLATAIHRTSLQRYLTAEYLLRRGQRRKGRLESRFLRAALITGVAQLIFMDRMPAHAVVDEAVELAKRAGRGASGLANAMLRKQATVVADRTESGGWSPSPFLLPFEKGHIRLVEALLPPVKEFDRYLSVATSHPMELVAAWRKRFGDEAAIQLLLASLRRAPTILRVPDSVKPDGAIMEPHEQPGFFLVTGEHDQLSRFMAANPGCWVQDPASASSVDATAGLKVQRIVDFCAGMGTKTKQLAQLHPGANITASDPDPRRFEELQRVFAGHDRVSIVPHDRVVATAAGTADLVVLDVPCSNTGVLARRLEARYRYNEASLESVVELQRSIIDAAAPLLKPTGPAHVLYATCSIEPSENEEQAAWAAGRLSMAVTSQRTILPGGDGRAYHDGSFHALLSR